MCRVKPQANSTCFPFFFKHLTFFLFSPNDTHWVSWGKKIKELEQVLTLDKALGCAPYWNLVLALPCMDHYSSKAGGHE